MSCTCRKAVYISEGEARQSVRFLGSRDGSGARRPYRCPGDPSLWHLTSKGRTKNKRRLRAS